VLLDVFPKLSLEVFSELETNLAAAAEIEADGLRGSGY
jgi:hypothetical protein